MKLPSPRWLVPLAWLQLSLGFLLFVAGLAAMFAFVGRAVAYWSAPLLFVVIWRAWRAALYLLSRNIP